MLFYPDQFFYANGPQGGSRRSRHHSGRHSARHNSHDDDAVPAWFGQSRGASPWSRAPRQQQVPDEYIVLDEDELNALRAFREAKRRTSQREQYEQAQAARRRAEAERKARDAARREAEARMRAQVEANARAAAREYLRRQQARQQAILEAQQAERQRQQQYLMEQLRQQFGLFAVPTSDSFEGEEQAEDVVQQQLQLQREQQQREQQEGATDSAEAAVAQSQLDDACAHANEDAGAVRAGSEQPRDQREAYDPIRRLIEALAPYPFVIATESSDEEESKENQEQEEESGDEDQTAAPFEFVVEPDTPVEGPTCETASDDSEPVYVEEPDFRVYSAEPPIPVEYDSGEEAPSLKDRRKERQTSAPVDHLKKAKTKESRRAAKKDAKKERKVQKQQQEARSSKSEAPKQPSGPEISGLLSALADELKRLQDAYVRLSNAKPTSDLREVISRLEAVKIGYSRSEEIYNKLDEVRAPKEERKLKHEITTESVALADKYEELLNAVYAEKKDVSAKNSRSPSPAGGASAAAGAAAAGTDSPAKHEVVLEEVQDESD